MGHIPPVLQRKQLMAGRAQPWLEQYVTELERVGGVQEEMVLVDQLLHRYHWSAKHPQYDGEVRAPSRPAATNLIAGSMTQVLALLDEIALMGVPHAPRRLDARAQFGADPDESRRVWPPVNREVSCEP